MLYCLCLGGTQKFNIFIDRNYGNFKTIYLMKYIADFHTHSCFSMATSKNSNLPGLFAWARVKGINIIGAGDFTHPDWFFCLKENLISAEPGLFRLKDEKVPDALDGVTPRQIPTRFILTSEISCIYKKNNRVRKIHVILHVPDFDSVEKINKQLALIGNIVSDGRPILGIDVHDLLGIFLNVCPDGFMIPAHVWTPWFSLFGSRSGFDSVEECFGDLSPYIFALETGLSSDPAMNRLISALDRFTLVSNSDCHSPSKLGREANMFDTGFDFFSMRDALKSNNREGFIGTVEFFPEEGKYHLDGHRKCNVCLTPDETIKIKEICPSCNTPITKGVLSRVVELADRTVPYFADNAPMYKSLIPLIEVLSEIIGKGPTTKTVLSEYCRVINMFGSDLNLLLNVPVAEIKQRHSKRLGNAVKRIRRRDVVCDSGYDGKYGTVKVFSKEELSPSYEQLLMFN